MNETTLLIVSVILLAACAAIIYPFKPFRKRLHALGVAFAVIALVGIFPPPNPDAASTVTSSDVQPIVEQVSAEFKDGQPSIKAEDEIVTVPVNTIADEPVTSQVAPNADEITELRKSFDVLDWRQTASTFRTFQRKGYEFEEVAAQIEDETLAIVQPLPVSEHLLNLDGYLLLATIRPNNELYASKVEQYRERIRNARLAAVNVMNTSEDRIEGITWYKHPNQPRYLNSRSTAYFYIGKRSGQSWLRMKVQYTASDWLFVNKVTAWHDGIKEPLISGRFDRDSNSSIWEWVDTTPDGYQIEVMRSLSEATEAILRFEGDQYHKDVTLSSGDKRAIRETLAAYEAIKNSWRN